MLRLTAIVICSWLVTLSPCSGQEPIDLFSDAPRLSDEFIRLGAWNLRHINIEGDADVFLRGETRDDDFEILVATFAKAVEDLGLDLVAITEVKGEDRVAAIRRVLNANVESGNPWRSDQTKMEFDFAGAELQLGVLWNSGKIAIDPDADRVLLEQRQSENLRAPWLIPVTAGPLEFDLVVVHLKAGKEFPQQDEVDALEAFMRDRLAQPGGRHLILCGDWNIRPGSATGRARMRQLMVPHNGRNLMRILTVTSIRPTLDEWSELRITVDGVETDLLPGSYVRARSQDSFLDHVAISSSLEEIFDHPIRVTLADGDTTDLRPSVRIVRPMQTQSDFRHLTDHLPVVLTLRTASTGEIDRPGDGVLRIVGVLPNPFGNDRVGEAVRLFNPTDEAIPLAGYRIADSTGRFWLLDEADGAVPAGGSLEVTRRDRPMALNNNGGDEARLLNSDGEELDCRVFGDARSGKWFGH